MAVFRVERNSGYTVMSNHHLRNKELTLKAKGLLSQMLSLPEDWDYTLAGLSHINRESIDAIRTAVWELEKAGYILRRQGRDEKGKMTAIEYTIYEQPQPMLENPIPGKPMLENPTTDNPTSENPTQLNKDRSRTNLSKKEKSITDLSSTDSFPILSPDPSPCRAAPERKGTEAFKQSAVDIYREIIMENIEYDTLTQDPKMDKERLDEIVDLMLETVCSARKTLRIAGDDYPAELVKSKFLKLNSSHIEFVMDDPQAAAKLEAKLVKLESAQETMKAVNAYFRKNKTLEGCPSLTPEQITKLQQEMSQSWHLDKSRPYPAYMLSNNNAEIRRIRGRIEQVRQHEETNFAGWEFDGGRVEANKADNRLQVFFDGKPDEAARDELKANGFRWAPSVGAWQRQLNKNAYYAAGYISCIQPISGEKPIDVQRSVQQQESAAPDAHLTGERVSTPRGSFHVADMTREQMEAAGYGYHHSTDDGKYLIMGNGTQAFAIAAEQREQENYMRTAELSTEQNYNMIDGQINNTPSVDELEEKAKRGEVISLSALAAAVKAEDGRTPQRDPDGKKPSIRAQLKADRAQSCKPQQREKEQEAKRSIRQALEMERPMNKFENVDVLASLQQIMQQNTAAFQNDFDIDKKILTQAAKSKNAEDKVYLWFSRPNGTHCLRERDVFLRGTREHNTFRFYHEQTKERVLAYAVVLSGVESGKVKGSIYELDYVAKAELAIQTALRTDNNRLIYENGSREMPKEYRFEATPDREHGKFVRYEAVPHDPDALRDLLRDESRKRERLKPGNFKEHIGRLSDEKVLAEAQRLSAAFQSLQAPNSPNGTHFVAEVSPWFERIASSKEHERLFALLPYKTLYLSSIKDRHGVFAFISKDERRDLPLRKQRPSVRAQLKEGQSKKAAAPKKAAAKAKDNDLEV